MDHVIISLRNLLRNYKRTTLTMAVLVFGIVAMLVYAGYIDFSMWGYRESMIKGGLGHLRVYRDGYNERGVESYMEFLMENEREVYRQLIRTPHVKEVTSELDVQGLVSNGESSEMTFAWGYDVTSVSVIRNSFTIKKGEFISGVNSYEIALGTKLAEKLNADVGSYLTFMTTTRRGALNAVDLKVVGIVETGIDEYDERLSVMSIEIAKMLLDVDAAEKFIVMLESTSDVSVVSENIEKHAIKLDIEFRTWEDLAKMYHQVKSMNENYFRITQLIILVIVAFSIVNTMRMVIYERMREIGTIRAIGMRQSRVVLMFLYEGILLGILSVLLGIATFHIVAWLVNVSGGIYIPPPPGQSNGYYTMIRPNLLRYFQASVIVVFSSVMGSLIPAFRAAQVKIDEALRYV